MQRPRGGVAVLTDGEAQPIAAKARWPTWNPLADRIAVSFLDWEDGRLVGRLAVLDLDGQIRTQPYSTPPGVSPVIAPGFAHYVYWCPSGYDLAFVAPAANGLTFFIAPEAEGVKPLLVGAPLFSAWSPDGRWLLVHHDTSLDLFDRAVDSRRTIASGNAAGFRAPAFSSDGKLMAYAVVRESRVELWCGPPGDRGAAELWGRFHGSVAFAFLPEHESLVVAAASAPDVPYFDSLVRLNEDGTRVPIHAGPLQAFFPAPDGERLAVVVGTPASDGRVAVHVRDTSRGRMLASSDWFVPSPAQSTVLAFFDQFQRSHALWAPDGSALVFAGFRVSEGPSSVLGDGQPRVLRWSASRGEPWSLGEPAELAFFPPAAAV